MKKYIIACFSACCYFLPMQVLASDDLYVGGDSVGIEVQYDGVMVTGTYSIQLEGTMYDPATTGILKGDIITSVQGTTIHTLRDLYTQISTFQQPINDVDIVVKRNKEDVALSLKTVYSKSDGTFQSGLYVKDKIIGVGTMTFYDPSTKSFGALGHEIMDSDLKTIAEIDNGAIYSANVSSITKAQRNVAGEKHATINYENVLGSIRKNTSIGIYGTYDTLNEEAMLLPWAKKEEVTTGYAQIYTVLSGNTIEAFDIEMTSLHTQDASSVKGIEFRISDERLLAATNGVIQGMSGSPIVQNGKIIGAITHVITSQPSTGYGVYIEWMIAQARQ